MKRVSGTTGHISWWDRGIPGERPVVLVHSLGLDHSMWDSQVESLAASHRILTFDLPGHGASSAAPGEYEIESLGRDLLSIADAAGAGVVDLVGISIGGLVALWVAAHAGDRVRRLVVANTAPRLTGAEFWSQRITSVRAVGMEGVVESVMPRFFARETFAERPDVIAHAARVFRAVDPGGYAGCCAALRDGDLTGQMGAISCPTLVIGGTLDVATPAKQQEDLAALIPGSLLEIIAGAAHLSNIDKPTVFSSLVDEFLSATSL